MPILSHCHCAEEASNLVHSEREGIADLMMAVEYVMVADVEMLAEAIGRRTD